MANLNNTDPAYWERQLKKYGLGVYQSMTDNSNDETVQPDIIEISKVTGNKKDTARLRQKLDTNDAFMSSYQVTKVRTEGRTAPDWTMDDAELRNTVLKAFPEARTHPVQARKAARWIRVCYLYHRMGMTYTQVAKEMGLTPNVVLMILRSLNYAREGRRMDGKERKIKNA
jgi:hypothetical protein